MYIPYLYARFDIIWLLAPSQNKNNNKKEDWSSDDNAIKKKSMHLSKKTSNPWKVTKTLE